MEKSFSQYDKIDQNREYWIDAIRSFACICVIIVHAPTSGGMKGISFIGPINYFAAAGASILFFMISGALVLYKPKPVIPFLKKRLSRIVFPMVFWSIVTLLISVWRGLITWGDFWVSVAKIPVYEQVGTFWFIYVIFGIYLVTPIFATWLEKCSKRDLQFYLLIWAITLCLPYLSAFSGSCKMLVNPGHGSLYYFYGYLWFAVMGYYLRKYVYIPHFGFLHFGLFAFLIVLPLLLYQTNIPHEAIQYRASINVVALCVCYFIIMKHLPLSDTWKRLCYHFAQRSFGIYLVHMLMKGTILKPLVVYMFNFSYGVSIPVIAFLDLLLSYLLVELISRLPGSKYIVGV